MYELHKTIIIKKNVRKDGLSAVSLYKIVFLNYKKNNIYFIRRLNLTSSKFKHLNSKYLSIKKYFITNLVLNV